MTSLLFLGSGTFRGLTVFSFSVLWLWLWYVVLKGTKRRGRCMMVKVVDVRPIKVVPACDDEVRRLDCVRVMALASEDQIRLSIIRNLTSDQSAVSEIPRFSIPIFIPGAAVTADDHVRLPRTSPPPTPQPVFHLNIFSIPSHLTT